MTTNSISNLSLEKFEPVIGLEIHARLATETKLFCGCLNRYGATPNTVTCPVCLGLPGVLPTLNNKAIELAVKIGLATHCEIKLQSEFARKNYFYPDLPKAYQISQFEKPLCENGWIEIDIADNHKNSKIATFTRKKRVRITRIHMEEDAGKLLHQGRDPNASYVDLNRAGAPLVEIVSAPDLNSAEEAKVYMETVHQLVTYLGVSLGNMEDGHLRADVNVSLREKGRHELGTRTETKNLNSFRFVQQAAEHEIIRQRDELLDGRKIAQETRLYNSDKRITYPIRKKEDSQDYRYFPDPDLPLLVLDKDWLDQQQSLLPELPDQKRNRYVSSLGLSAYDAKVLVSQQQLTNLFEELVAKDVPAKQASNWVTVEVAAILNQEKCTVSDLKFGVAEIAQLIELVQAGTLSSKMAKHVFEKMSNTGQTPAEIVKAENLVQLSDQSVLTSAVAKIIAEHPKQVAQYQAGNERVFSFFVGQIMRVTEGRANPIMVNDILKNSLKKA